MKNEVLMMEITMRAWLLHPLFSLFSIAQSPPGSVNHRLASHITEQRFVPSCVLKGILGGRRKSPFLPHSQSNHSFDSSSENESEACRGIRHAEYAEKNQVFSRRVFLYFPSKKSLTARKQFRFEPLTVCRRRSQGLGSTEKWPRRTQGQFQRSLFWAVQF